KLYCFGEVLWDLFPSGAKPGGAPMNVAIHAQNLGLESAVISAIGTDKRGQSLLDILQERGVNTGFITRGDHSTGTVTVDTSNPSEVRYTIDEPSAWDFIGTPEISWEPGDLLLHGSLATRNKHSYQALKALRAQASTRVFDLNLRAPFIDSDRILELLEGTEIVKVNQEEYALLAQWLKIDTDPEVGFEAMYERMGTQELLVTRGSQGALWVNNLGTLQSKVFPVTVKDTVGAGDSFLAAMLFGNSHLLEPKQTLDYATALGAMVASKEGANPLISTTELKAFIDASSR
ncbi:MAG: carbohydrate kinase, partial [Schleiferiaceae bacterium]|nr:carbohydrate kinase [Schleiferiaceae bacterium]